MQINTKAEYAIADERANWLYFKYDSLETNVEYQELAAALAEYEQRMAERPPL